MSSVFLCADFKAQLMSFLCEGCFIRTLGVTYFYRCYMQTVFSLQYFLTFFSQAYQFQFLDLNASLCKGDEDDSDDSSSFSDGEVNST